MKSLVALALVAMASPAAARCDEDDIDGHRFEVLNDGAAITADGGVIVETNVEAMEREPGPESWTAGTAKPTVVTLAPGLVLLQPPAQATELRDSKTTRAKFTFATSPASPLAAPRAKAIIHSIHRTMAETTIEVTVHLRGAVPADAIALVAFDAKGKTARSFEHVEPGETTVVVYRSCSPEGTIESRPNEAVTLRWVDRAGRFSAPSKPIRIARGKPV